MRIGNAIISPGLAVTTNDEHFACLYRLARYVDMLLVLSDILYRFVFISRELTDPVSLAPLISK